MTDSKVEWGRVAERVIVAFSVIGGLGVAVTLAWIGFVHDYSVFWTAARASLDRPEILYDPQAITDLQHWIGGSDLRPWIYPPSTLLYLLPFSVLPFEASLWAWGLTSLALYVFAAHSFAPHNKGQSTVIATVSFVTMVGLVHGQTSPAVAGLVVLGLSQLDKNSIRAGLLFGVAATIKPQIVVLVPLALVAGRHYKALAASVVAGSTIGVISILTFGFDPWVDWAQGLTGFLEIVDNLHLLERGASPSSLVWRLGFDGPPAGLLRIAFTAIGIVACWKIFQTSKSLPYRLVALIGGGVFTLPYAMGYDLAALAPAAAYFMVARKTEALDWALALASLWLLFAAGTFTSVSAIGFTLLVFYRVGIRPETPA